MCEGSRNTNHVGLGYVGILEAHVRTRWKAPPGSAGACSVVPSQNQNPRDRKFRSVNEIIGAADASALSLSRT
jgi:hypothetical protein